MWQTELEAWRRQAGARRLEVGWALLAAEANNKPDHLLRVQQQFCTQNGRGRIHSVRRAAGCQLSFRNGRRWV